MINFKQENTTYVYQPVDGTTGPCNDEQFDLENFMEMLQAKKDQNDVPLNIFKFKIVATEQDEELFFLEPVTIWTNELVPQ